MRARAVVGAVMTAVVLAGPGCVSLRGPETIGAHVDDASITNTVQSRMVEDKAVDATDIVVVTTNGNVALSGYARNPLEKSTAESVAIKIRGVKSVQNNIAVRP